MGTHLEEFLEKIRPLPAHVQRNFALISTLDERAHVLQEELVSAQKAYLDGVKAKVKGKSKSGDVDLHKLSEDKEALDALETKRTQAIQLTDEKIAVAGQAYDLVDDYIRQLDQDLIKFEQRLRDEGAFQLLEQPMDPAAGAAGGASAGGGAEGSAGGMLGDLAGSATPAAAETGRGAGASGRRTGDRTKKRERGGRAGAPLGLLTAAYTAPDEAAIDPNEPAYCICKRVSFGEMVGCDNDDCETEWFHFGCVGLKEKPKGKWYCDDCLQKMKRQRA